MQGHGDWISTSSSKIRNAENQFRLENSVLCIQDCILYLLALILLISTETATPSSEIEDG